MEVRRTESIVFMAQYAYFRYSTNRSAIFLFVVTSCFVAPPAWAAPNGLTQIPIAKVFGDGVASFSIAQTQETTQGTTFTTQYGVDNNFEVGIDYQASPADQKTFLTNVKYLLAHNPGHIPDIAIGLTNLATGQKAVPYAVATTQPRAVGISLGMTRPNSGNAADGMAGISYNVTPRIEVVGDYIGGRESYGTLGIIANVTDKFSVNVAFARPNSSHADEGGTNPNGYIVNLAYTFHLKGGSRSQAAPSNNPAAAAGGAGN